MIIAAITIISFVGGVFLLASGVLRLSSPMVVAGFISVGLAVAAELAAGHLPPPALLTLPDILPATHAATTDARTLDLYKEAGRISRAEVDKRPTIVSVERIAEPGVFDDVILVYGSPDNYAIAREMAAYASRKYKRDYRFTTVQQ